MWRNCVRLARGLGHSAVLRLDPKVSGCGVVRGLSPTVSCSPTAPCSLLWNSVTWLSQARQSKDYALPNSSWSQGMMDLYNRFLEMCKDGTWKRIPSYGNSVDHIPESLKLVPEKEQKGTRLFSRNMDTEGLGFEYAMFLNPSEKRMVCLFQPGPYLAGHPGFAHGGSTATIIDSTVGGCAIFVAGRVMTANLSINYRNPIPLGSVVLVDSKVDQVEGRKVFLSCQVKSIDGQTLHAEATALFIQLNSTKSLQEQMSSQ
ncbi:acyl-coenzyme A thioesterase THEM4 [Chelonia mydas]|uniref:acyl-coenzyme A thioesterase THEM4 n=1 Tax=Chelonia mydas TaxID=8469 RepID=UPI0018A24328|nr:acyl-coenzyme A thioesterase THEM4 [Chelonia mydas]XP_037738973.1 acyl-coenzyme A thioesterase THEM4 [Chelonia mydas]XP_037738974.1 acyl-coenzyme A thioesterase THEM4 [Chelonia mydas]XP_043391173.1 acyl-coenzyme A thioesterase THEM4 [Chelonia mydas]XP_043391174.1 acyl-coenzyme A thioesterase THEM4 [Chelonia mydas]